MRFLMKEYTYTLTYLFAEATPNKVPDKELELACRIVCAAEHPFDQQEVIETAARCLQSATATVRSHDPKKICDLIAVLLREAWNAARLSCLLTPLA